jgi:hypothetical protein
MPTYPIHTMASAPEDSKPGLEQLQQAFSAGGVIVERMDQIDITGPLEVLSRVPDMTVQIIGEEVEPVPDVQGPRLSPRMGVVQPAHGKPSRNGFPRIFDALHTTSVGGADQMLPLIIATPRSYPDKTLCPGIRSVDCVPQCGPEVNNQLQIRGNHCSRTERAADLHRSET